MTDRDRTPDGRPQNARPRDALARPLPPGEEGVERVPGPPHRRGVAAEAGPGAGAALRGRTALPARYRRPRELGRSSAHRARSRRTDPRSPDPAPADALMPILPMFPLGTALLPG